MISLTLTCGLVLLCFPSDPGSGVPKTILFALLPSATPDSPVFLSLYKNLRGELSGDLLWSPSACCALGDLPLVTTALASSVSGIYRLPSCQAGPLPLPHLL